jgi:hypothetical protein
MMREYLFIYLFIIPIWENKNKNPIFINEQAQFVGILLSICSIWVFWHTFINLCVSLFFHVHQIELW